VKTKESEHVDDCIKGNNLTGVNYFLNNIKENQYATAKREPLGKPIIRNYEFPEEVKQDQFRFGVQTTGFYSAKDVIFAGGELKEQDKYKKLYTKTHGQSDPGEQKNREYNWPFSVDSHSFGKTEPFEKDGTEKSLKSDFLEAQYPKTKIVPKRLEDFRQATADPVGIPKYKGTMSNKVTPDTVFGVKSVVKEAWNAGKCLAGEPSGEKAMMEDSDLGKSVLYRSKLKNCQPVTDTANRVFGVPSIRVDKKKEDKTSIADNTNYGNEKDVYELLYPHPCHARGLDDIDFEQKVERSELESFLKIRNFEMSE